MVDFAHENQERLDMSSGARRDSPGLMFASFETT